jgi:hypothetical protein
MEIKKALLTDGRFRESLPTSLKEEVIKFLANPGCPSCSVPLVRRILNDCPDILRQYFVGREIAEPNEEIKKLAQNNWSVINCHIDELEDKMKKLSPGRKQIAVARYNDQVTVIVNELDLIY